MVKGAPVRPGPGFEEQALEWGFAEEWRSRLDARSGFRINRLGREPVLHMEGLRPWISRRKTHISPESGVALGDVRQIRFRGASELSEEGCSAGRALKLNIPRVVTRAVTHDLLDFPRPVLIRVRLHT